MLERVKMWMDVGLHYNRVWTGASERLPLCAGQRIVGQQFGGAKSSHDDYGPSVAQNIPCPRGYIFSDDSRRCIGDRKQSID